MDEDQVIATMHSRGHHRLFVNGRQLVDAPTEIDLVRKAESDHGIYFRDMNYRPGGGTSYCFLTYWWAE